MCVCVCVRARARARACVRACVRVYVCVYGTCVHTNEALRGAGAKIPVSAPRAPGPRSPPPRRTSPGPRQTRRHPLPCPAFLDALGRGAASSTQGARGTSPPHPHASPVARGPGQACLQASTSWDVSAPGVGAGQPADVSKNNKTDPHQARATHSHRNTEHSSPAPGVGAGRRARRAASPPPPRHRPCLQRRLPGRTWT